MELTPTLFDRSNIRVLHLETTTRCNAACPQCARTDPRAGLVAQHDLSLGQVQKMFDVEFIQQLDKIFACGNFGDPAVSGDTMQIFEWAKLANPGIVLGMNTNGGVRDSRWWQRMGQMLSGPLDYVVFAIDGLADTNHIYRQRVNFDHVMQSAQAFIQAGGHAHWDMLIFEHNQHQVDQCRQLARDMGFTRFRTKVSSRFAERPVEFLQAPTGHEHMPIATGNIQCHAVKEHSLYVSATGEILPCCFIGADIFTLSSIAKRYIQQPGYQDLISSWDSDPLLVCKQNCSSQNNTTRFYQQWQEDTDLLC